jgi:hypothetical protein
VVAITHVLSHKKVRLLTTASIRKDKMLLLCCIECIVLSYCGLYENLLLNNTTTYILIVSTPLWCHVIKHALLTGTSFLRHGPCPYFSREYRDFIDCILRRAANSFSITKV